MGLQLCSSAGTRPKKRLHSRRIHAPKTPRRSSRASLERRRGAGGGMLSRCLGLGMRQGGRVGPNPAAVLRGDDTYPVLGAGGTMPAVASHLHTVLGRSRMQEGSGGTRLGGEFPLRTSRALGGQEEVAARRFGFLQGWFLTWLIRLVESRLLPSIPPSSPIQAQQSPWVMRKRRFTLTLLHNPARC